MVGGGFDTSSARQLPREDSLLFIRMNVDDIISSKRQRANQSLETTPVGAFSSCSRLGPAWLSSVVRCVAPHTVMNCRFLSHLAKIILALGITTISYEIAGAMDWDAAAEVARKCTLANPQVRHLHDHPKRCQRRHWCWIN